jgi:hypothetical protein
MTFEQAEARAKVIPLRAVNAALSMANRIEKLRNAKPSSREKVTIID